MTDDIGIHLRWAARWVASAVDLVDRLPDKPTGDEPAPFRFDYTLGQLALLKQTLQDFEERLSARPEVGER